MTTETTASSDAAATETTAAATVTDTTSTTAAPAAAGSREVTLRQFARELSLRDKRVALLHGFVFEEELARRFKDTEASYQARYVEFANKPI
jgi:zona occludens toxin (predicted ATPase)